MSENTTSRANEAITFADILFIIRKNIILLLIITVLFGIGGGIYGFKYTKTTYTAVSTAMIAKEQNSANNPDIDYSLSLNLVHTFQQLLSSEAIFKKTSEALRDKYEDQTITAGEIKGATSVSIEQYGLMITISATTTRSSEFAIDIANQLLYSSIEYANNDLETTEGFKPLADKIIVVDIATSAPQANKSKTILILSILIGFVVGLIAVVIKQLLNDTFTSREEFERNTGLNVLVMLPNPVFKGESDDVQEK